MPRQLGPANAAILQDLRLKNSVLAREEETMNQHDHGHEPHAAHPAGVLYKEGVLLSPALGAVFMSLSTIIVAVNAQLLARLRSRLRSA
jgi:hypothetical protein